MSIPYKHLLKERNFTSLLIGRLLQRSALILFSIELIWLTMDLTDHSPLYLSIMTMGETLPFIVFGLYGGIKADQWNKKKVMVICNMCAAILFMIIPLLYFFGFLNYYILLVIVIGVTIFSCFSEPCYRAILPELLKGKRIIEGNALLDSIQRGVSIIIPASIGLILKLTTQIHLFTLGFFLWFWQLYVNCS